MRDIKFRAYKNGMMSKPFYLGEGVCWPNGSVSTANRIGVIMQYIGLKDTNGKEIYEGDIVISGHGHSNFEVLYCETDSCFKVSCASYESMVCDMPSLTIIGNIYENPELLDGEK